MQIELKDQTLVMTFAPTPASLRMVRSLPNRRFDAGTGTWQAPWTRETWDAMRAVGFDLTGVPEPKTTGYAITAHRGMLRIKTPWSQSNLERLRRIPDYRTWSTTDQAWRAKPTRRNVQYLLAAFPQADWDPQAAAWRDEVVAHESERTEATLDKQATLEELRAKIGPDDYKHGGPAPFDWQRRCFLISRDMPAFAVFAEQRTGKTKLTIDTACWNYIRGQVRQALVIAPNSTKTEWVTDALPEHMPDYVSYKAAAWQSSPNKADEQAIAAVLEGSETEMCWLVMNVEALSTPRGAKIAMDFVRRAPTFVAIDESTRIKTPRSARTKAAQALRRHAKIRRILTGTPATQGPLDLYSQFEFLDPKILGFGSFYAFRNRYALMGGFQGKAVLGYQHLDELQALIDPYSFRITRDECFDLPPKGYQKRVVEMTPEQTRIYRDMVQKMRAEMDGRKVTAQLVIVQMLRLAQIAGGFVAAQTTEAEQLIDGTPTIARPIPGGNPKVDAVMELAGDVQGKMIVWCRFRPEIEACATALRAEYGADAVVEFHGGVDDHGRIAARTAFQDPNSSVRFLVGQTETGGFGINLDQARTICYVSNGFSLESRLQSEDRASSVRQRHSVAIVDVIARGTVDERVVGALRGKRDVSRMVTGDAWKEWI
jgi:hypothetical protein